MIQDSIEGVVIDTDEDGLHLILFGENGEYDFTISGIGEELFNAVRGTIGPWLQEMEAAQADMRVVATREDGSYRVENFDEDPYDPLDPKHPTYHERLAEVWDSREGK